MQTYFTADTHFFHTNIIKYANRPFANVDEMHEKIIENWNNVVTSEDRIYHLGDFVFGDKKKWRNIIRRLNGHKFLIKGNHDKDVPVDCFASIHEYKELVGPKGVKIVLSHYAFEVWNKSHHGAWHLHGHSHGTLKFKNIKRLDIGVDTNDMKPYSIDEIEKIMETRGFDAPDNHGNRIKK